MTTILIHHHLQMGDSFICNGLVREIANRDAADRVFLVCKASYYQSIYRMYLDDPRIIPVPAMTNEWGGGIEVVRAIAADRKYRIGFERTRIMEWDVSWYEQENIPFEKRWTSFKCNRDMARESRLESILNPSGEPFVLIHNHTSERRNYDLPVPEALKRIYVNEISTEDGFRDCFPDWIGLVLKADQVHCVDSGFAQLAMSVRPDGIFHSVDRCKNNNQGLPKIKPGWTLV